MTESTFWQPIETAPLDRVIQLWRNGQWDVGRFDKEEFAKKPKPYWLGYYSHWNGVRWMRLHKPTHWMPLPDAPT